MVNNSARVKHFSEIICSMEIKNSVARRTTENQPVYVLSYLTQVIHGHTRVNLDHWIDRFLTRSGPHVHVTLLLLFQMDRCTR